MDIPDQLESFNDLCVLARARRDAPLASHKFGKWNVDIFESGDRDFWFRLSITHNDKMIVIHRRSFEERTFSNDIKDIITHFWYWLFFTNKWSIIEDYVRDELRKDLPVATTCILKAVYEQRSIWKEHGNIAERIIREVAGERGESAEDIILNTKIALKMI